MKHVDHYCHGGEETIDKIKRTLTREEYIGFCKGNVIKYKDRAPYKGDEKGDIDKMLTYLEYLDEIGYDPFEKETDNMEGILGFNYPPLKDAPGVNEQFKKVAEEMVEAMKAHENWTMFEAVSSAIFSLGNDDFMEKEAKKVDTELAINFLIECEDVIHAIEELQRAVMRKYADADDEDFQDAMKAEIQLLVFDKNDKRGYYNEC